MKHGSITRRFCGETVAVVRLLCVAALFAHSVAPIMAQTPDWSVDASAFASTMSVTATAFSGGDRLTNESDLLAAFVGNEIRGVTGGTVVGDEVVFFLTAYANLDGQTLAFRLYDSVADSVLNMVETLPFQTDGVVGDVANPKVLTAAENPGLNSPDWTLNAAAFGSTMNVVAELFFGGTPSGHSNAIVGAFVGGEVRGVASPVLVGGRWLFFMTVYGDGSGDPVAFEAYDPVADAVVAVEEQIVFAIDGVVGGTSQPLALNAGGSTGASRPSWALDPTAFGSTMNVIATFFVDGSRSDRSDDLVAAFVNGELRGVGSPTTVAGENLFFLTVYGEGSDGLISFRAYDASMDGVVDLVGGTSFTPDAVVGSIAQPFVLATPPENGSGANAPNWSANAADYSVSMNMIGTLVVDGVPNTHADSRVAAFVGEQVRGVAAPTVIAGRSLFFLTVYANGPGETITFRAYDAVADSLLGVKPPVVFRSDALDGSTLNPYEWSTGAGENQPDWTPDSTAFAVSMSLVAQLSINGEVSTHPGNRVAAFVGDELRGSSGPENVDGHVVYSMALYADASGETLRFEAYDAAADTIRTVGETLVFEAGSVVGTPASPFALSTVADAPQAAPALVSPVNGALDIPLDPTLVWGSVARENGYEVELATSVDFVGASTFAGITSTSLALAGPLAYSTLYFWRVRGVNSSGAGPWSTVRRFTTVPSHVGIDGEPDPNAQQFELEENYPNPFDTETWIGYSLAQTEHVRLVVLDLLGRRVATIVDGVQAAGHYTARLSTGDLASGMYLYRMTAGSYVRVRTMTVLR